jgi:hypothetical protein
VLEMGERLMGRHTACGGALTLLESTPSGGGCGCGVGGRWGTVHLLPMAQL